MLITRTRTAIIVLIASAGFTATTVAPAVSQAQYHNYCVAGQCTTHTNFTQGGVSPCTRIAGELDKGGQAVGDDKEWKALKGAGEWMATKELENAEAIVLRARQEALEWGCDVAPA